MSKIVIISQPLPPPQKVKIKKIKTHMRPSMRENKSCFPS